MSEYELSFSQDDKVKLIVGLSFFINFACTFAILLMLIPFKSLYAVVLFFGIMAIHFTGWFLAIIGIIKSRNGIIENLFRVVLWELKCLRYIFKKIIKNDALILKIGSLIDSFFIY